MTALRVSTRGRFWAKLWKWVFSELKVKCCEGKTHNQKQAQHRQQIHRKQFVSAEFKMHQIKQKKKKNSTHLTNLQMKISWFFTLKLMHFRTFLCVFLLSLTDAAWTWWVSRARWRLAPAAFKLLIFYLLWSLVYVSSDTLLSVSGKLTDTWAN